MEMFIILSMPPINKLYVLIFYVAIGDNFKELILMEAVYEEYYYKRAHSKTY